MEKIYQELGEEHPLVQLIQQCLHNDPEERPDISEVLELLEQARAAIGEDEESEMNKLELMQKLKEKRSENQVSSYNYTVHYLRYFFLFRA